MGAPGASSAITLCIICYYGTALLVQLPNTLALRLSLLPITLYLTCWGITSFDAVEVFGDPRFNWANYANGIVLLALAMREIDWTFCRQPLQRTSTGPPQARSLWTLLKDTCDLTSNSRGIGWTWSGSYKPPPHTRPTSSTSRFLLYAFTSAVVHVVVPDCALYIIQFTDWENFTNPYGASLFNSQLSPIPRYLLSTFNSALVGLIVYCRVQSGYDVASILSIIFFKHSPLDWPPLFNSPWRATSLVDLWSNRWHQLFRRTFIQLGIKPLTFFVGKRSGLGQLGAFIVSALFHDLGMWGMAQSTDFPRVGGYFIIQSLGVLLESTILKKLFGGKVDGWKGWIWTMSWTVIWGNMVVDAWCQRGLVAGYFGPGIYRPSVLILDTIRRISRPYI